MSENPFEPEETESQQLNRIGKMIRENVDREMREKLYSQAEADALIAGAYAAAAEAAGSVTRQFKEFADDPVKMAIGYIERSCGASKARSAILDLTPDAARLALEEREAKYDSLKVQWDKLQDRLHADFVARTEAEGKLADCIKAATAREAKLIADTRLEEAEWWDDHCGMPGRNAKLREERLAARRAAVQEGK